MADSNELESIIRQVRNEIDNYEATVQGLHALIGVTIWEEGDFIAGTHYSLGRRMDTSTENRAKTLTTVTPDAIIQRSAELGYIAEAKGSLPQQKPDLPDLWDPEVEQLHKYDDDLKGWWTRNERIAKSDIVVMIRAPLTAEFVEYVRRFGDKREWSFTNNICFTEFDISARAHPAVHLRRHEGNLTDSTLTETLRKGEMVPIEGLVTTFGSRKFYDGKPPVEYLMVTLWHGIFNEKKSELEYDEVLKCWPIQVQVSELTTEVQKLFGSPGDQDREAEYPRQKWVRLALDAFVRIGYAKHIGDDEYEIRFKKLQRNLVDRFAGQRLKAPPETNDFEQLRLLEN